jgi:competence protein ComEC
MIEFLMARPFIYLFGITAFVFSIFLSNQLYFESDKIILFTTIITLSAIFCFYINNHIKAILLLIVLLAFFRCIVHLNKSHNQNEIQNISKPDTYKLIIQQAEHSKNNINLVANWKINNGVCLIKLSIPNACLTNEYYYGDTLSCKLNLIRVYSQPRFFNSYSDYLLNKHIFYKAVLTDTNYSISSCKTFSIYRLSQLISGQCSKIFKKYIKDENSSTLMTALLLGDKSELDSDIKNSFIATGTSHILAVSGLHLGMIYIVIQKIQQLIKNKSSSKNHKAIQVIILLLLIWCFSFISGLSASIVRAALMLSIFEFGKLFKRSSDSINSLFSCAFLMIFINPCTLKDVGFQLSITAVLSIICFNSFFSKIFNTGNKFFRSIKDLLSVTLSVQILVSPFTIYYFHKFPTYFIIANFVWIPLSFVLMFLSFGIISFSSGLPLISSCIGNLCSVLIKAGLIFFKLIKILPYYTIDSLWIFSEQIIFYELSCISLFFWMKLKNNRFLFIAAVVLLLIPITYFKRNFDSNNLTELVIYYEQRALQLEMHRGNELITSCPLCLSLKDFRASRYIKSIKEIHNLNEFKNYVALSKIQIIDMEEINYKNTYRNCIRLMQNLTGKKPVFNYLICKTEKNVQSAGIQNIDSTYLLDLRGPFLLNLNL